MQPARRGESRHRIGAVPAAQPPGPESLFIDESGPLHSRALTRALARCYFASISKSPAFQPRARFHISRPIRSYLAPSAFPTSFLAVPVPEAVTLFSEPAGALAPPRRHPLPPLLAPKDLVRPHRSNLGLEPSKFTPILISKSIYCGGKIWLPFFFFAGVWESRGGHSLPQWTPGTALSGHLVAITVDLSFLSFPFSYVGQKSTTSD